MQKTDAELLVLSNDDLLAEWYLAEEAAEAVKPTIEYERAVRKLVADRFFPAAEEGTNKRELENNFTLKCVVQYKREVQPEVLPAVTLQLEELGIASESIFRFVPTLDVRAYKAQPSAVQRIIEEALVVKPQSPQVEIVKKRR